MRVAALEDNVAFLEQWCEEQQDALDRTAGPVAYDYEIESDDDPPPRAVLRVVDLREVATEAATEHDRTVHQLRLQLNRLRTRLAATVAPPCEELPGEVRRQARKASHKLSAKPAGHTAP